MAKTNIEKELKECGYIIYSFQGTSMFPLLIQGEDKVHLKKEEDYQIDDVVLFKTFKGHYVLHRIIGIKDGKFAIIGDNANHIDYKSSKDLLAKMVGIYKKDKYCELTSAYYKNYMETLYPYRHKKDRENVLEDADRYFLERLKNAYYELLKLMVTKKLNKEVINCLTLHEKYAFYDYVIAKKALPALGLAVSKHEVNLSKEMNKEAVSAMENAKARYIRSEAAVEKLSKIFSEEYIPHTFLKGCETRSLYPVPYLRVSNDIDLLVPQKYFLQAKDIIIGRLKGKFFALTPHDESYVIDSLKMDVELHHHINTDLPEDLQGYLEDPVSRGISDEKSSFYKHLTTEDQLVIALSHAGKHINGGEFWSTMLLDIYYLSKKPFYKEVLKKFRLEEFYNTMCDILSHIFEGTELSEEEKAFEDYLFKSRYDTYISLQKGKYTNKFKYILNRIWLPYRYLTPTCPTLKKFPILLPFYEVKRWFHLVFQRGKFKKAAAEVNAYNKQNQNEINALKNAGLNEYIVRYEDHNKRF